MASTYMNVVNCWPCVRVMKWIPVAIIMALLAFSYYSYVIQFFFTVIESTAKRIAYLVIYHALFAMMLWSYWQTMFTEPLSIPYQFKLPLDEAERMERGICEDDPKTHLEVLAKNLPVRCCTINRAIRYCEKCHHIKPDRAHHCSVCGVCVLKMDHHCPWINQCVSFTNYKFFILFIAYSAIYCTFMFATVLQYAIEVWTEKFHSQGKFYTLSLFFALIMFVLSLMLLLSFHCYLISKNRTTLESIRPPVFIHNGRQDKDGFNLGAKANFIEVFGGKKLKWLLPVFTSLGDGVVFVDHKRTSSSSYSTAENRSEITALNM